jgi:hypothetical protein
MIRVEYKIVTQFMDSITFRVVDMNFDVLLINQQGLYYLFHPAQILNCLSGCFYHSTNGMVMFNLYEATQIPAEVAKILTGEER